MGALCNGGAPRACFREALEKWTLTTAQMFKRPFFCFDSWTVRLFVHLFVCLFRKPLLADTKATSLFREKMRARNSNIFITAHKYSDTIPLAQKTSNRTSIVSGFYYEITFSFSSSHLSISAHFVELFYKTFHLLLSPHPSMLVASSSVSLYLLSLALSPTFPTEDPQTHPFLLGRGNERIREEMGVSGGNAPLWDAELG